MIQKLLTGMLKGVGLKDLDTESEAKGEQEALHPVVFLGFFRDASSILYEFEHEGSVEDAQEFVAKIMVVDFNPTVMRELRRRGIKCVYGDVAHIDTLQHAHIAAARLVVSTITDDILRGTSNLRILKNVRHLNPSAHVVLASDHIPQALLFYDEGADFVYVPRLHSARDMARLLQHGLARGFSDLRQQEVSELMARHEVLA